MAKFIYRVILAIILVLIIWFGIQYYTGKQQSYQKQHGVELVKNMKESDCNG